MQASRVYFTADIVHQRVTTKSANDEVDDAEFELTSGLWTVVTACAVQFEERASGDAPSDDRACAHQCTLPLPPLHSSILDILFWAVVAPRARPNPPPRPGRAGAGSH